MNYPSAASSHTLAMDPQTPLHRDASIEWPMLLPSAMEMTPPDSHARAKDRSAHSLHFAAARDQHQQFQRPANPAFVHYSQGQPDQPGLTRRTSEPMPGRPLQSHNVNTLSGHGESWTSNDPPAARMPSYNAYHVDHPGPQFYKLTPSHQQHQNQQQQQQQQYAVTPRSHSVAGISHHQRYQDMALSRQRAVKMQARQHNPMLFVSPPQPVFQQHQGSGVGNEENDDETDGQDNKPTETVTNYKEYGAYLLRQKRIPDTKAMVWSEDVEEAFMEGLRLIPRVGRRKITVGGRLRGRNELIADYIYKKTKQRRSRKQVSSHIQVLKHVLKSDEKFMNLVADVPEGAEGNYENISADTFDEFISKLSSPENVGEEVQIQAETGQGPPTRNAVFRSKEPEVNRSHTLLTPPNAGVELVNSSGGTTIESSGSAKSEASSHASQPPKYLAPRRPGSPQNIPDWFASHISTPPQRRGHHRRNISASMDLVNDKIVPTSFRMCLDSDGQRGLHMFTCLMRPQLESPVKPPTLDRLSQRFPEIQRMLDSATINESTPIIHGAVKLDVDVSGSIPAHATMATDVQFLVSGTSNSQLMASPAHTGRDEKAAFQRVPTHMWQCVTKVSSMGNTLYTVTDTVTVREELLSGMERLYIPFTADFWAPFLRKFYEDREPDGSRCNSEAAIGAITVTQTIKLCPNDAAPGVAFVVIYEFERAQDPFSARTVFRRLRVKGSPMRPDLAAQFVSASPRAAPVLTPSYIPGRGKNGSPVPSLHRDREYKAMAPPEAQTPSLQATPRTAAAPNLLPSGETPSYANVGYASPGLGHHQSQPSYSLSTFDGTPFQRSLSTVNGLPAALALSNPPMAPFVDGPLSATEPTDFASFNMLEGERIQRSMTAFELPATWQEPDVTDWYGFE